MKNYISVFLIGISFVLYSCKNKDSYKTNMHSSSPSIFTCTGIVVYKDTVFKGEIFYGVLKPYKTIDYTSPTNGIVEFARGGLVRKGEMIIAISDSSLFYKYGAIKQKIKAKKLYVEKGFYDPEYYSLLSEMKRLEYKMDALRFRAPFAGIVELYADKGDKVKQNEKVFSLYETDFLKVEIPIFENNKIYPPGTPVRILRDSTLTTGHIDGYKINSSKNLLYAVVKVPNSANKLKIGDFVRVKIIKEKQYGIKVPNAAIKRYKNRFVVFKISKNRIVWQYVSVSLQADKYSVVTKGLNVNDTVLIKGVDFATHNMLCKKVQCLNTY